MKTRFLIITAIVTLSIIILSSNVMTIEAYHNDKTSRGSSEPEIATFGTNAYVVWEESMDPQFSDVYFRKIVDNSSSFDEAINLTLGTSFYPDPSILASKNNVYVLWEDRIDPDGKESVYFKKSNDDGKTFDNTITLDPTTNDSIYRPITMLESNGILYVFVSHWNPQTQRNNLSFITSDDNGNAFSDPVILFESEQWEQSAHIIVKDDVIYAVADDANNYDEAGDLNFRKIYSDKSTSK
ncbi:MAG: sialidase family protein, partial [Nitrosopumilaceae archaeon]